MKILRNHSFWISSVLILLAVSSIASARLVVLQSSDSQSQEDGAQTYLVMQADSSAFGDIESESESTPREIESASWRPRGSLLSSFFSPLARPVSWLSQQLQQVDAMQAMSNAMRLVQQQSYEDSQREAQRQQMDHEVEGMLRHVGCQRYRNAMKEYMQAASQKALEAAQEVDRAVAAFEAEQQDQQSDDASNTVDIAMQTSSADQTQAELQDEGLMAMLDGSDASDAGITESSRSSISHSSSSSSSDSSSDVIEQDASQRGDTMDEDDQELLDGDGLGGLMGSGSSIILLGGGMVAGQLVKGGNTREWATGMNDAEEREAEQAEAEQDRAEEQQLSSEELQQQQQDLGSSMLLDLLVRASEDLVQQKRQTSVTSLRPLLRGGGVVQTVLSSTSEGESEQQHQQEVSERITTDEADFIKEFMREEYEADDMDKDAADPVAAASDAFWSKKATSSQGSTGTSSRFYSISSDSLFNAIFSLFDSSSDSSEPFQIVQQHVEEDDINDAVMISSKSSSVTLHPWSSSTKGTPNPAFDAAASAGLDVNFDGAAEINLFLFDPSTGEINWELLMLFALLFAIGIMISSFMRSWLQLRLAMGFHQRSFEGHMLVPIMVERNGRMVRCHMLVPEDDNEDVEVGSTPVGGKGDGLYYYRPPAEAEVTQKEEVAPQEAGVTSVVMASDYVAGEALDEPLLRR